MSRDNKGRMVLPIVIAVMFGFIVAVVLIAFGEGSRRPRMVTVTTSMNPDAPNEARVVFDTSDRPAASPAPAITPFPATKGNNAPRPASRPLTAADEALIERWHDIDEQCRGSYDEEVIDRACAAREAMNPEMAGADLCYGREGEYGYQQQWHRCGPGSIR